MAAQTKRRNFAIVIVGIVLVAVSVVLVFEQSHQAKQASSISSISLPPFQWHIAASPNDGVGDNELSGIAAEDANHAWAIGFSQNHASGNYATLIERWNGGSWSVVASPDPGNISNFLSGVTSVDAQNAWAVGASSYQNDSSTGTNALIVHWDGSSWAVVPHSQPEGSIAFLLGVAAVNTQNAWAVGFAQTSATSVAHTLIEHWDGRSWTTVPSPNADSGTNELDGIAAVNANDAWAVGFTRNTATGITHPLIEHWDGSSWSVMPSPAPGKLINVLAAIVIVNANDIWADGYEQSASFSQTLIEHWNGKTWAVIPSKNPGDGDNELFSINAVDANNIWGVGNYHTGSGDLQTLIERWNGKAWSLEASPNPGNGDASLDGIVAMDAHHSLAVGEYHQGLSFQTLVVQGGA
jgi:hypothetical protein